MGAHRGFTHRTAVELNVFCHFLVVLAAFALSRRFFSIGRSFLAAALVAILPPYPGYLSIAYPELMTAAAFVLLVAAAAWIEGGFAVFLLGGAVGGALLFRETMLFALPIFAHLLGTRRFLRRFLPGLALVSATLLPPLSARRAVHPNALYPNVVTEAFKGPDPVSHLALALAENIRTNLEFLLTSNPAARAEDAVLLFLIALLLSGLFASFGQLQDRERGFLRSVLVSAALLFSAMIAVYVVRERGGVWGGVRALMPIAPLVVVALCGLTASRLASGVLVAGGVALSLFLNSWQIAFFNRYKGSNLEDQDRAATFIEERTKRYAPRRVAGGRYFQYGFRNFPVEMVWSGAVGVGEGHAIQSLPREAGSQRHGEQDGKGAHRAVASTRPHRNPEHRGIREGDRNDVEREVRERHPLGRGKKSGEDPVEDRGKLLPGGDEGVARVQRAVDEPLEDRNGDSVVGVPEAVPDEGETGKCGQGGRGRPLEPGQGRAVRAVRFIQREQGVVSLSLMASAWPAAGAPERIPIR